MESVAFGLSSPQKNAHRATTLYIGIYEWRDEDVINGAGNHGEINVTGFRNKWEAHPVRCVRE